MISYEVRNGLLTVDVFTCKRRLPNLCKALAALMSDGHYTTGFAIVRFHAQQNWADYAEFVDRSQADPMRMSAIGIIVEKEEQIKQVEWRAGLLRPLGVQVGVFRTPEQLAAWVEDKLPEQQFAWVP